MLYFTWRVKGEKDSHYCKADSHEEAEKYACEISHSNNEQESIYWNFYGLREISEDEFLEEINQ